MLQHTPCVTTDTGGYGGSDDLRLGRVFLILVRVKSSILLTEDLSDTPRRLLLFVVPFPLNNSMYNVRRLQISVDLYVNLGSSLRDFPNGGGIQKVVIFLKSLFHPVKQREPINP